jgi:hypothetical protein
MTAPVSDWVIDVDTHITEPPDVWTSRLATKFQERAPRMVRDPKTGWDVWKIGDGTAPVTVGHTAVAGWKEPFPAAPRTFEETPPASHDAKARLAYMDSVGIWAMALYPNVGGFGNESYYAFDYSQVRRDRPHFTLRPSEYFARQVYGCYFFEELAPQRLLDRIGEDRVLFETDYPHPVCLYGNVREKIEAGLAGQPERVQRKLLFENAARLYRVEEPNRPWAGVT